MSDLAMRILINAKDDASKVIKGVERALGGSGGGGGGLFGALKGVGAVGLGLAKVGVAAAGMATAIGAASVHAAADFQQIMLQSEALANVSKQDADAASAAILQMAVAMGQAPQDLAKGFYYIASTGASAKDSMIELALAAKAAAVGNTTAEVTANALTAILATYGLKAKDAGKITDEMVASVSAGKTEFEDYAKVIGVLATNAKQAGISFEEATSAFSSLSNVMSPKQAKDATDALLQTTSRFTVLESRAKSLGLQFDVNAYKSMNLEDRLKYLQKITGGNTEEITKLIGRQNAMAAFTDLSANHFENYNSVLQSVLHSHGDLDAAFAKTSAGFNAAMNRIAAAGQVLLITIGNMLLPELTKLADAVTPLISQFTIWITKTNAIQNALNFLRNLIGNIVNPIKDGFNAIFHPVKQVADAFQFVTVQAKPLLDTFDRATGIFKQTEKGLQPLADTFDRATYILNHTSKAAAPLLDTFDRATGVFKQANQSTAPLLDTFDRATAVFPKTTKVVKDAENPWKQFFQNVKNVIDFLRKIDWGGIGNAINTVAGAFQKMQAFMGGGIGSAQAFDRIGKAIQFISGLLSKVDWGTVFSTLWRILQQIGSFLQSTFIPVWQELVTDFNQIKAALQPVMPQLRQFAMALGVTVVIAILLAVAVLAGLIRAFASALIGVMRFVTGAIQFFTGFWQFIQGVVNLIADFLSGRFGKIGADLDQIMHGILQMFIGVWNMISGIWYATLGAVQAFTDGFIQAIVSIFQNLADMLVGHSIIPDMLNAIVNVFATLAGRVVGPINNAVHTITSILSGAISDATNAGANIVKGIADGIQGAIHFVAGAIGNVASFISSHLPHSPAKVGPLRYLDKQGAEIVNQVSLGMLKARPTLQSHLNAALQPGGISASSARGGGSGTVVNHYHNNITVNAPALSRREAQNLAEALDKELGHRFRSQYSSASSGAL